MEALLKYFLVIAFFIIFAGCSPNFGPKKAYVSHESFGENGSFKASDFYDTQSGNSFNEDDSLFDFVELSDGEVVLKTSSEQTNIHSHLINDEIYSNFVFSGQMLVKDSNGGIGVTFLSQYPNRDAYYRIRRWQNQKIFEIENHGNSICSGKTLGLNPEPNQWINFEIETSVAKQETSFQVTMWHEDQSKIDGASVVCRDRSSQRFQTGTFGVWAMGPGEKYWANFRLKVEQDLFNESAGSNEPTTIETLVVQEPDSDTGSRDSNCGEIVHNEEKTRVRYRDNEVQFNQTCLSEIQTSVCEDGEMSPYSPSNYQYDSCHVIVDTSPPREESAAPSASLSEFKCLSPEMLILAKQQPLVRFSQSLSGGAHSWSFHYAEVALAVHAACGDEGADDRLLQHLRNVLIPGNGPTAQGGYADQHQVGILTAFSIAKRIPRVWSQLDSSEKSKIDLIFEAALVSNAFVSSDSNPFVKTNTQQYTIDGSSNFNRGWNPNYRAGTIGSFIVASSFMGVSKAIQRLQEHNHQDFIDRLKVAGLRNLVQTFESSNIPTNQQIESTLNQSFSYFGIKHESLLDLFVFLANFTYGKNVDCGLNNSAGIDGGGRIVRNCNLLPNKGELGMLTEFDSTDASGKRSSAHYALDGLKAVSNVQIALIANGVWTATTPVETLVSRMRIGIEDLFFKVNAENGGYINYSNGKAASSPSLRDVKYGHDLVYETLNSIGMLDFKFQTPPEQGQLLPVGPIVPVLTPIPPSSKLPLGFREMESIHPGSGDYAYVADIRIDRYSSGAFNKIATPSDITSVIANLNPGDRVLLKDGNYGTSLDGLSGKRFLNEVSLSAENLGGVVVESLNISGISRVNVRGIKVLGSMTVENSSQIHFDYCSARFSRWRNLTNFKISNQFDDARYPGPPASWDGHEKEKGLLGAVTTYIADVESGVVQNLVSIRGTGDQIQIWRSQRNMVYSQVVAFGNRALASDNEKMRAWQVANNKTDTTGLHLDSAQALGTMEDVKFEYSVFVGGPKEGGKYVGAQGLFVTGSYGKNCSMDNVIGVSTLNGNGIMVEGENWDIKNVASSSTVRWRNNLSSNQITNSLAKFLNYQGSSVKVIGGAEFGWGKLTDIFASDDVHRPETFKPNVNINQTYGPYKLLQVLEERK